MRDRRGTILSGPSLTSAAVHEHDRLLGTDEIRSAIPGAARNDVAGRDRAVERPGHREHTRERSQPPRELRVLDDRPAHVLQRIRARQAGQHPLCGRALLDQLPGLHGRWCGGGGEGGRRDLAGPFAPCLRMATVIASAGTLGLGSLFWLVWKLCQPSLL